MSDRTVANDKAASSHRCIVHQNYFDLVRNAFGKCAFVDQLALFTFVDRYVSPNHVIFFLMKETLGNGQRGQDAAKFADRDDNGDTTVRNVVTVDDGTIDGFRRQKAVDFDLIKYARPGTTQRLYLNSRRDYSDAIARLNNYEANENGQDATKNFLVSTTAAVVGRRDNEFFYDQEDSCDEAHAAEPSAAKRSRVDRRRVAGSSRNVLKLFSSSARSVHQHYAETCQLLERFWSRCESQNQLRRVEQQCSKIVTHITYLIQSNNIPTNVVRSFDLSSSALCLFRATLTDSDNTPESQLLDRQHASWPINETWNLHHEESCRNDREIIERENYARQLRIRVSKVRNSVTELLSRLTPIEQNSARQLDPGTTVARPIAGNDVVDDTSDEQRLFQLSKFAPTSYPMSVSDFRSRHQSEFALSSLRLMVDTVVRLAHTPCLKLYDFVITSNDDFWSLMHRCLDYGIECYEKNGIYPTKHSLWDIGLIQRNELSLKRSYGTENADCRLDDYHLIWLHAPTLLAGNLTVFAQSFRRLFLMCFNTSACYMLNLGGARNRRKLGGKHDCRLSKASQNAYHAVFLRMNLGHELLCKATIETASEAVAWLNRYDELSEAIWLKLRIKRPDHLARHLTNLRSRLHYDEIGANGRFAARMEDPTNERNNENDNQTNDDNDYSNGYINDTDDDYVDNNVANNHRTGNKVQNRNDVYNDQEDDFDDDDDDESVLDYAFENESNY